MIHHEMIQTSGFVAVLVMFSAERKGGSEMRTQPSAVESMSPADPVEFIPDGLLLLGRTPGNDARDWSLVPRTAERIVIRDGLPVLVAGTVGGEDDVYVL
mmetsp:Transcript_25440/g.61156  ORF Transcript_25440/g.61156 Transcript_25440/m.61156 type:complete len:100 (+) Transcript_25440:1260-1559(+)